MIFQKIIIKRKKRGKRVKNEEDEIAVVQRHPGRKIKVAKVSYDTDQELDDRSAEEIAIEREMDREHFREQKKNRASSQKTGPKSQPQIKPKTGTIELPSVITVKEFAEKNRHPSFRSNRNFT